MQFEQKRKDSRASLEQISYLPVPKNSVVIPIKDSISKMFHIELDTLHKNDTSDRLPSNMWNAYPQSCVNDECRRAAKLNKIYVEETLVDNVTISCVEGETVRILSAVFGHPDALGIEWFGGETYSQIMYKDFAVVEHDDENCPVDCKHEVGCGDYCFHSFYNCPSECTQSFYFDIEFKKICPYR